MDDIWKGLSTLSSKSEPRAAAAVTGPSVSWLAHPEVFAVPCWKKDSSSSSKPQTPIDDPGPGIAVGTPVSSDASKPGACSGKKKRAPDCDENALDRKKKRLMKNRASADRSRARKQAHTYQLEAEVVHLMKENAQLRQQQEKLVAAAFQGNQPEKSHKLQRCSTAPF